MNFQESSLRQRTINSGSWVLVGHLLSQIIRFGSNLILTRLLVPEMFGIMAVVSVVMAGLAMFSDVGLLQSIIRSKRGCEENYLHTVWTLQIIRGVLIFVVTLCMSIALYFLHMSGSISPETVYGHSDLPIILALMSVTAVINGFNSVHLMLLNRKLMLSKRVVIELSSQLVGISFMVSWAWLTHSIWSLVIGSIIIAVTKMILSHTMNIGGRCQICWDKVVVNEVIHFGKWIFISSIFGFLLSQGDRLLLGGLIGAEMLGVYSIAFFLATAGKDLFSKLIGSIFFPVLSETVRNNPDRTENIYYKIKNKIDMVVMLLVGFLYTTGSDLIRLLYDSRYNEAGWMLEILSLSLVSSSFLLVGQYFLAHGRSKVVSILTASQALSFFVSLPILFFLFGLYGAVWSVVFGSFVRIILACVFMKKYFFFDIKKELIMIPMIIPGVVVGNVFISIV